MFLDLFINEGFIGDNQQIFAIAKQITSSHFNISNTQKYKDNDPAILAMLEKEDTVSNKHVLIFSGSHGLQFLKQELMKRLIDEKKPIVIWVGHQDPGILEVKDQVQIVALPQYVIKSRPELNLQLANKLVPMFSVPNTLTEQALKSALIEWDAAYPEEAIVQRPDNDNLVGIFLGGDAPEPEGNHRYWTETEAEEQGFQFGRMAQAAHKVLLICNGPRTSKFYPNSPNPKAPILWQFNDTGEWIPLPQLSEKDRQSPDKSRIAHAPLAPLDPVSAAFLRGIKKSGLPEGHYQFFDFKFGEPGKPAKSAYKAIISALFQSKNPIAFYSGESISYAELAYFIPNTYAFRTESMNEGHYMALEQFKQAGVVTEFDFAKSLSAQMINVVLQMANTKGRENLDAKAIVEKLKSLLPTLHPTPQFQRSLQSPTSGSSTVKIATPIQTPAEADSETAKHRTISIIE